MDAKTSVRQSPLQKGEKKQHSSLRKLAKIILIIFLIILGCGVLFLVSWALPWGYSSTIAGYAPIDGAAGATVDSYVDDEGRLNFIKADGKDFVVMDITDVHLGCSPYTVKEDKLAMQAIHKLADSIKPDLIVVTGDCIYSAPTMGSLSSGHSQKVFASFMETLGIPWTVTFGNHESEVYAFASREKMGKILESDEYKNCVFTSGPQELTGIGNQVIIVRNNDENKTVNQVLMLLDSNDYTGVISNYDSIHKNQIEWYKSVISSIATQENRTVREIGSLAFFHIPVTEYETAYDEGKIIFGTKNEPVCHPANTDEDVFFSEMQKFGSTRAMFAGHDHTNNYQAEYQGILLTYSLSIDYVAYKDIDKTDEYRGATVVNIKSDNTFSVSQCHYGDIK
ncbi:MAG: hypothetical protein GX051_09290 [Clostridiales bacterium]|nr:hypothetical protein [Clostridiales bacterium]